MKGSVETLKMGKKVIEHDYVAETCSDPVQEYFEGISLIHCGNLQQHLLYLAIIIATFYSQRGRIGIHVLS